MPDLPLVLLVELPVPPLDSRPTRGSTPLAAGCLVHYARHRGLDRRFDLRILPAPDANRLGDRALLDAIDASAPAAVGFSCFLWNVDRTLSLAERLKARRPETQIVLGGPEATPDHERLPASPAVDFTVIGEGEQTFADLLGAGFDPVRAAAIPGIAFRDGGRIVRTPARRPLADLDLVSSPWLSGVLDAGEYEQMNLETVRGCAFRCRFCHYPNAWDVVHRVSPERVLANLSHARERGAREVFLLDPTLNQRPDFAEFLRLLARGNPDRRLEYHAELRAEGVTPEQARLLREANFAEVEIGLQSVDPVAQRLMDRRVVRKAFEAGIRALRAEGVRTKVDLIVGLPGDTVESVRRGMRYLVDEGLFDGVQVFPLLVLPGTPFREDAARLGLEYQPMPPYRVLRTATLGPDDIPGLLAEAEEVFGIRFDPRGPPDLGGPDGGDPPAVHRVDLDREGERAEVPARTAAAFTLRIAARDPWRSLPAAARLVRAHLAENPFSTLQVVLETGGEFPLDVLDGLAAAAHRPVNLYLDRIYETAPGRPPGATRLVVALPAAARAATDPRWVAAAQEQADLVWRTADGFELEEC